MKSPHYFESEDLLVLTRIWET